MGGDVDKAIEGNKVSQSGKGVADQALIDHAGLGQVLCIGAVLLVEALCRQILYFPVGVSTCF